jgi:hypothetical protein
MIRKSILWLSAAMLAVGVAFFSTDTASAQWGRYYNNYGYNYRYNHSPNYHYGNYGYRYYPRSWGTHYHWHDTSHYDYHPPSVRWHGNHFDVTPGHYDYHPQGHWDRH